MLPEYEQYFLLHYSGMSIKSEIFSKVLTYNNTNVVPIPRQSGAPLTTKSIKKVVKDHYFSVGLVGPNSRQGIKVGRQVSTVEKGHAVGQRC